MRIPLDQTNETRNELYYIQQDCIVISAALTAASVVPTAAPTAVGHGLADLNQWRVYHAALVAQLTANSVAYPA
jgi:hypothetical protein